MYPVYWVFLIYSVLMVKCDLSSSLPGSVLVNLALPFSLDEFLKPHRYIHFIIYFSIKHFLILQSTAPLPVKLKEESGPGSFTSSYCFFYKTYTLCPNTIDVIPLSFPNLHLPGKFPLGITFIKWFVLLLHFAPNDLPPFLISSSSLLLATVNLVVLAGTTINILSQ